MVSSEVYQQEVSKLYMCKTKKVGTVMCTLLNPSCMNVSPPGSSSLRMLSPRLMASLWIGKKKPNTNKQTKKKSQENMLLEVIFSFVEIFLYYS